PDESYDDVAFQDWISRSPEHQAAFNTMVQAWMSVDEVDHVTLRNDEPVPPIAFAPARPKLREFAFGRRGLLALAASLSLIMLGAAYFISQRPDVYRTDTAAVLALVLDDGSRLRLDGSTQ